MSATPSLQQIDQAREFLSLKLPATRLVKAVFLSERLGAPVYLKLESELPTGSFKVRGALFALASRQSESATSEVVTSSTGNHGAAVAHAAKELGVRATIFLPTDANPAKRARILALGARLIEAGKDISAAADAARQYATDTGAYYLNDITNPFVAAATATIACEILEQAPDIRKIIVPMGDTALIRGMATVAKSNNPSVRVIGVQAATAPSYQLSWMKAEVIITESCDTIADGLATRIPNSANVAAIRDLVDDVMLVTDDEMRAAMRELLREAKIVAEPAGAAATAAALKLGRLDHPTALVVTGANVRTQDMETMEGVS